MGFIYPGNTAGVIFGDDCAGELCCGIGNCWKRVTSEVTEREWLQYPWAVPNFGLTAGDILQHETESGGVKKAMGSSNTTPN